MGHNVVFWSPVPGQTGTTSNLIAATALLALEYSSRVLLFGHLQSRRTNLEQAFAKRRTQVGEELAMSADAGIDALVRLVRNRKLTPSMIRDYTIPILKDRLDLLPGSNKPDKAFVSDYKEALTPLLELTGQYYDLTLIDGGSGTWSVWTQALLQHADLVVVNLNQNLHVLTRFFQQKEQLLEGKKQLAVLGQYAWHSAYTAKNLARRFRLNQSLYVVPHNAGFMDAAQEGHAIDFFFRNRKLPRDHENYVLMQSVRVLTQGIIEQAGLNKPFFGGKGE